MKKICVIGRHARKHPELNGQSIKTEILTNELKQKYGSDQVLIVDTARGKKSFPVMLINILIKMFLCKNIIILPAHNGIKVIAPVVLIFNYIFRRKLHYVVIGGWIASLLEERNWLKKCLSKFDCIYVETSVMKKSLEMMGFTNIVLMTNFKHLVQPEHLDGIARLKQPYKLCTFSRVMKEKGIEDAINCVKEVNKNGVNYCLDIYGPIDEAYSSSFKVLQNDFPPYVKYKGTVDYGNTVNVLKDYTFLLFPTRFYTEGVPGTIIDAYAASLPVIASKWESFDDVISDGITGIGYEFGNNEGLIKILVDFLDNQTQYAELMHNCGNKYKDFLPGVAIEKMMLK